MLPVWFTWTKEQIVEGDMPKWWLNFVNQTSTAILFRDINVALVDWNAKLLRNNKGGIMLIFRSRLDLMGFLLRWQHD